MAKSTISPSSVFCHIQGIDKAAKITHFERGISFGNNSFVCLRRDSLSIVLSGNRFALAAELRRIANELIGDDKAGK